MVKLQEFYFFGIMLCLAASAHRVNAWNRNTESERIATMDSLACLILAIVVLANLGVFYIFNEKTPFTLFISGGVAFFIAFKHEYLWAETTSGFLVIASLLYKLIPTI